MAKPILQYKVNTVVNPLTQEKVYTPMLTDRAPAVSLETVVKSAKDKGYLPGLKDVSAKALAEGVLSSLKDTLAAGTNVKFGDYFYAKLALNGKCDGAGRLSKQNGINVRFRQGELIKVDIDDFELQNLDTPLIPTLDYLLNDLDGAVRNVMKESQDFLAVGAKLVGEGTTTKLEIWNVNADGVPTGTAERRPELAQVHVSCQHSGQRKVRGDYLPRNARRSQDQVHAGRVHGCRVRERRQDNG